MARYVLILKAAEDSQGVTYQFGPDESSLGVLWLDKHTGEVKQLEALPLNKPDRFFMPAAVKVRQHWREGNFPERSCWAS